MKLFKKNIPILLLLFFGITAQIKVDEIKTFFMATGATFFACHVMPDLVDEYRDTYTLKILKEFPAFCTYSYLMLDNGVRLIHAKPPVQVIKKISYRPPRFTNKSRTKK